MHFHQVHENYRYKPVDITPAIHIGTSSECGRETDTFRLISVSINQHSGCRLPLQVAKKYWRLDTEKLTIVNWFFPMFYAIHIMGFSHHK